MRYYNLESKSNFFSFFLEYNECMSHKYIHTKAHAYIQVPCEEQKQLCLVHLMCEKAATPVWLQSCGLLSHNYPSSPSTPFFTPTTPSPARHSFLPQFLCLCSSHSTFHPPFTHFGPSLRSLSHQHLHRYLISKHGLLPPRSDQSLETAFLHS